MNEYPMNVGSTYKTNYVCFECRTNARRPRLFDLAICPTCGKEMTSIWIKNRVPKKSDNKGWKLLMKMYSSFQTSKKASHANGKRKTASC